MGQPFDWVQIKPGLATETNNGNFKGNLIFQTIGNGNLEVSIKVIPVFLLTFVCLFSDSRVRRKTGITVSARFSNSITVTTNYRNVSVTLIPVFLLTIESEKRQTRVRRKTGSTFTETSKLPLLIV